MEMYESKENFMAVMKKESVGFNDEFLSGLYQYLIDRAGHLPDVDEIDYEFMTFKAEKYWTNLEE